MLILITGEPGIGKTTILLKLANMLKNNAKVGGVISREIRSDNIRIGFEFIDLATNNKSLLASTNIQGPKIGKYHVSMEGCRFAANALNKEYDIIICDELGPMELKSKEFRDAAKTLLNSDKDRIVSIHKTLKDPLIDEFKSKADQIITVTFENRDVIPSIIFDKLIKKQM